MNVSTLQKENTLDTENPASFSNEQVTGDINDESPSIEKPRRVIGKRSVCITVTSLLVFVTALTSFLVLKKPKTETIVYIEDHVPLITNCTSGITIDFEPGFSISDLNHRELSHTCSRAHTYMTTRYNQLGVERSGACNYCPSQWSACHERRYTANNFAQTYLKKYGGTWSCTTTAVETPAGYWCDSRQTSCGDYGCLTSSHCYGKCTFKQTCTCS
mmetsp:Transcript_2374/g.3092  ORF Transcript_2374/g.3092 Transcript_2374/m.3092 type:complete len:216 (+) Transcript_2374:130-777(+)